MGTGLAVAAQLELAEIRAELARHAAGFDASVLAPCDAEQVVREAATIENIAATLKSLAAVRAAQGGSWRREGARSPAHDLARKTGTSVGRAKEALDTAEKLAGLPALDAAARKGDVSAAQAAPIADAASADPTAEERLLAKAKRASYGELRDECARTKAAAEPDDDARHRAIHAARFLRQRRCADGAAEIQYRSTVDEVAEIIAVIRGHANRRFDLARLAGRREPEEAYLADGLLAACRAATGASDGSVGRRSGDVAPRPSGAQGDGDSSTSGGAGSSFDADDVPRVTGTDKAPGGAAGHAPLKGRVRKATPVKVVVRLDWDALVRGWPIGGEVCEIPGLGPVPVSVVRAMLASGDAILAAVVTRGVDVASVVHLGRKPTAYQGTALDWLAPSCTTEGCNNSVRLETDHRVDWAKSKVTLLRWLERLCEHCHDKKTRLGWALVDGHGKRPMVPPEDPRHPKHHPPPAP